MITLALSFEVLLKSLLNILKLENEKVLIIFDQFIFVLNLM